MFNSLFCDLRPCLGSSGLQSLQKLWLLHADQVSAARLLFDVAYLAHNPDRCWNSARHAPYLTLPAGWAGCYTCPALRPYQFGPICNTNVTEGHSKWLWSRSRRWSQMFTSHLALVTCSMVVLTIWSALSWLLSSTLQTLRVLGA